MMAGIRDWLRVQFEFVAELWRNPVWRRYQKHLAFERKMRELRKRDPFTY